jgi:amidohydrolase
MDNIQPVYIQKAIRARHYLHQNPEISGQEKQTHNWLVQFLASLAKPPILYKNLGKFKTGLVAEFRSELAGPTIMLRADSDALPIMEEPSNLAYASEKPGYMHACGHDGHSSLLLGIAQWLQTEPLKKGRLQLLFQPAEETGEGAVSLLEDETFSRLRPDFIYGLHNIPGEAVGSLLIKPDTFCFASTGIKILLHGASSHAAEPEKAISPALALTELVKFGQSYANSEQKKLAVTYAGLGEPSFGICPGQATIHFTARAITDSILAGIVDEIHQQLTTLALANTLRYTLHKVEPFSATVNHQSAFKELQNIISANAFSATELERPYFWSEDFGQYSRLAPTCFFGIGSGENIKPLHHPAYNFPDELVAEGISVWKAVVKHFLF